MIFFYSYPMQLLLFLAWAVAASAFYIPFRLPQIPFLVSLDTKTQDEYMTDPQFELWVAQQSNYSFQYILENIGGVLSILDKSEVAPGVVIASPLKEHPNYFYNWIRDSALTLRSVIYYLDDGAEHLRHAEELRAVVEQYMEINYELQRLSNPSGDFDDNTRSGLGEPKFMPDASVFKENWGRPQSDGPGLRVLTISNYIAYLKKYKLDFSNNFLGNTSNVYYGIVRPDLEYIMANWKKDSFDLWEEINSVHLFNALTQLRALKDGHKLAKHVGDSLEFLNLLETSFNELKNYILDSNTGFTQFSLPYLVETPSLVQQRKRAGLDAATLLASLHAHNLEYGNTDVIPFDVEDGHVLSTISAMVADMKYRYPINHDKIRLPQSIGVALGRYPEDIYDGYGTSEGNPWFISTATAAEVLYKWIFKALKLNEDIVLTSEHEHFFAPFFPDDKFTTSKTIVYGSEEFGTLLVQMFNYSDSFLQVIQAHVDSVSGKMLEQFNKYHGFMQGAESLTWSYSAFYNSVRWRLKTSTELDKYFEQANRTH